MKLFSILSLLLLCLDAALAARILAVFAAPAYSHYASGVRVLKELAHRGHQVTVLSSFPQKKPLENFKDIKLVKIEEHFAEQRKVLNLFQLSDGLSFLQEAFVNKLILDGMEKILSEPAVQDLINSDEKFDLVIVEEFFTYCLKPLAKHFDAHLVLYSSLGTSRMMNSEVGNPDNPSYVIDSALGQTGSLNFWNRLQNTQLYITGHLIKYLYAYPRHNQLVQKYFPNPPDLNQVTYNVSLALVNSHVSTNQALPTVPVVVEIGGVHVDPPKKLPRDLQEFLDEAREGAVFFSMGSNLRSADMTLEQRELLLKVLGSLKLKVLWKWEEDDLPGCPENVLIRKWLPQNDILAHPNVKVFLSHGGLLSTIEAVYHGVPVIGLPVYGDQRMNMANAVGNGFAISIVFAELTEEKLSDAFKEVLTNQSYTQNAKRRSKIMHDQPMKPLDKAIFWIEYVLRHQGAPHLRVSSLNLSWYQYLLLDVIAFALLTGVLLATVLCLVVKRLCCKSKLSSKKLKTN